MDPGTETRATAREPRQFSESRAWPEVLAIWVLLAAVAFVPGVVRESNLDARPINAAAAVGLLLAVFLSLSRPRPWRRLPGDRLRLAVVVALVLVALPWIAANLGFSFGGVPVLGQIFQTNELRSQPGVAGLHPAVHLGHHQGLDGLLLPITARLAIRVPVGRPA